VTAVSPEQVNIVGIVISRARGADEVMSVLQAE